MAEIRNLTRNGETFYPLTCSDAVLNRDGEPLGPVNDIFDVSEYNASGTPPVLAKYESLSLALAAIPSGKQKGGMTIRYVQTSDNKYHQFRYLLEYANTTAGNTAFLNVDNWQGVDNEIVDGKNANLVDSEGIVKYVPIIFKMTGNNNLAVGSIVKRNLIPNHTYRFWIKNPNISMDGVTSTSASSARFFIKSTTDGENFTTIAGVGSDTIGNPLPDFFDATIPSDSVGIRIVMKAKLGEVQTVLLQDISILKDSSFPYIFSSSVKIENNNFKIKSFRIRQLDGNYSDIIYADKVNHSEVSIPISTNIATIIVYNYSSGNIETYSTTIDVPNGSLVLFHHNNGKILGGAFLSFLAYEKYNIYYAFSSTAKIEDNSLKLTTLRFFQTDGNFSDIIYADPINHNEVSYPLDNSGIESQNTIIVYNFNTSRIETYFYVDSVPKASVVLYHYDKTSGFLGGVLYSPLIKKLELINNRNNLIDGNNNILFNGIGFNSSLIGNDDKMVAVDIHLKNDVKYTLDVINPQYNTTNVTNGNVIFCIRARVNGSVVTPLVSITKGETVSSKYDFTMPSDADSMFLYIRANKGESVFFRLHEEYSSDIVINSEAARNSHVALMNKYAERYDMQNSIFLAANGNSYVTAKDLVKLCIAAIANNIISSFWGKEKVSAAIYGEHKRVEVFKSTYTDVISHPMVADLKNYYYIFGGKTGSGGNPSQGRNLVVAVKSKVDDAWLVGCVLYSTNDVQGDNRFSVMKDLFDLLETHRDGTPVDASGLSCQGAYAVILPSNGNEQNYTYYADFVSVGKNENTVIASHSVAKLATAIVVAEQLDMYKKEEFTQVDSDAYSGSSGTIFYVGDVAYNMDYMTTLLLTSSSRAAVLLAREVGEKTIKENEYNKLYSFGILGKVAYGENTQTWLEWLSSADYLEWSTKTGITLTCAGSSSEVVVSSGGSISGVTGGTIIQPNTLYT